MPYEVLGSDIAQPEGRDDFIGVYSHFREVGIDLPVEMELEYGRLESWAEREPDEAIAFMAFCSDHEDPIIRGFAGIAVDQFIEVDPEFTLETIEKLLSDEDRQVRERVSNYYFDGIGDSIFDDFVKNTGLKGAHRLIKAVKSARLSLEDSN